jgi:Fe-S cluster assembly protein SufD
MANPENEVTIPVADPNDPYAIPAAMPSSADKSVRSFSVADFSVPTSKQDDWHFTPIDRVSEFFSVFTPSATTVVTISMMDGSAIDPSAVSYRIADIDQAPSGTVLKPADRISAVEWESAQKAYIVEISESLDQPVLISIAGKSSQLDALHIVIKSAANVHAHVVLQHSGLVKLAEGVEIEAGDFSQLSVTSVQQWDPASKHVGSHRIHVGREADVRHSMVTLSGDVVRIRIDQDFGGEQAKINMLGIYFVDSGSHIEHRTMVVHNAPDCISRVVYKGALEGKGAHSTWVGNALIEPTAPGTDSYELNRNLILSPGAIADSEPNLEIENGNIIGAGHASSVGRFDEEQLFYLQSRGISEVEARKLVIRGFFAELLEEIGIPSLTERLMLDIDERLSESE